METFKTMSSTHLLLPYRSCPLMGSQKQRGSEGAKQGCKCACTHMCRLVRRHTATHVEKEEKRSVGGGKNKKRKVKILHDVAREM